VTITKYHDASTLPFLNALIDSEHMGIVNIRFYDGNAAPGVLLYDVELSNALISARSESETTADYLTEELQMTYQMITWTWAGQTPLTAGEPEPIVLRHALMPPTPNPMHANATFRFGLPEDTYATLEVFDVSGRLVRDVFDGAADMNEVVHWDGRDRSGNSVANGVYLVRLEWKGGSATRRVTVLE
jgi:hypothetical protein